MSRVDILVPSYNTSRFLPAALDSVEAQTFTDWRILLVDDGSTDNTAEIVAPYRERLGSKLEYIWQANAGLPAARNAGLRQSTAEFVALLDADDVWLPERLAESVKSLEQNPDAGLSYGFVARVDAQGKLVSTHDEIKEDAEGWIVRSIYTRRIDLPCPTITFRRESVERVGNFDETMRATEDRDLWLRIALDYPIVRIPKIIAYYRISPGAMTSDVDRMFNAQMRFIEKHYGSPGCDAAAYRQAKSTVYRQKAEMLSSRQQAWPAFKNIARALQLNPVSRVNLTSTASILWHSVRPVQ